MRFGPVNWDMRRKPCNRPTQTVGLPSAVVRRDLLMIVRRVGSFCASMTPCTPVTQMYPFALFEIAESITSSVWFTPRGVIPTPRTLTRQVVDDCGMVSERFRQRLRQRLPGIQASCSAQLQSTCRWLPDRFSIGWKVPNRAPAATDCYRYCVPVLLAAWLHRAPYSVSSPRSH